MHTFVKYRFYTSRYAKEVPLVRYLTFVKNHSPPCTEQCPWPGTQFGKKRRLPRILRVLLIEYGPGEILPAWMPHVRPELHVFCQRGRRHLPLHGPHRVISRQIPFGAPFDVFVDMPANDTAVITVFII